MLAVAADYLTLLNAFIAQRGKRLEVETRTAGAAYRARVFEWVSVLGRLADLSGGGGPARDMRPCLSYGWPTLERCFSMDGIGAALAGDFLSASTSFFAVLAMRPFGRQRPSGAKAWPLGHEPPQAAPL